MRFSEPPTYTVQELEQKARQFLAARFGQDVPIPVDVDLLIEHEAGVDLDYSLLKRSLIAWRGKFFEKLEIIR